MHEAVIAAKKTCSGCTVHQVTEEVDSGPIVVQEEVEVAEDETAESLKAKVGRTDRPFDRWWCRSFWRRGCSQTLSVRAA